VTILTSKILDKNDSFNDRLIAIAISEELLENILVEGK
jgi:hypothetical protein